MTGSYYYSSDGSIFTSKIEAMSYCEANSQNLNFYYHDDVWSKLNWRLEPEMSLDYYYREQCQRIRQEYDYLILCYSGGYDSTNILETFHFNNIKLDKIVMVGAFSQDSASGVDENHNGELYHNCFPYIRELGLESISETFDYTELFTDPKNFSIYEYGSQWYQTLSGYYSPHHWFWRDLEKFVIPKKYMDKKVAIIFGKDKTAINHHEGKFMFSFSDDTCFAYGNRTDSLTYSGYPNIDRINFYWDENYPLLLIKQTHVLKHAMRKGFSDPDFILYNLKKPLAFKSPKSKSRYISLRDAYLLRKKDSSIYDFFFAGLRKVSSMVKIEETKPIWSRLYYIN